jgi:hypothetical protein
LLFAAVRLLQARGVNPEVALNAAAERFVRLYENR